MSPSQAPPVRPQSHMSSEFASRSTASPPGDITTAPPLAPNQSSHPLPDLHASPASIEKPLADSPTPDAATATPHPTRQSMVDLACGPWRPHYSPSLKFVFAIIVMIVWPWVFYGIVKRQGGIEMDRKTSNIVRKHSQDVDYFVTAVASSIAFLIGYLFQASVTRLAQRWVVFEETDIFRLSFFSALKNRAFVWSLGALPSIFKSARRLGLVFTVILYIAAFILITPGLTALLHPQTLARFADLSGTEIDFASNSPACREWFNNNDVLLGSCGWEVSRYPRLMQTLALNPTRIKDIQKLQLHHLFRGESIS